MIRAFGMVLVALLAMQTATSRSVRARTARDDLAVLRVRRALLESLFHEQLLAVQDPCRRKCIWTTRRAGKTWTVMVDFLQQALKHPLSCYVYIGLTRDAVRKVGWRILKELNLRHKLGVKFQEQLLVATLPNGSTFYFFGADRPDMSDRLHGMGLGFRGAVIDETARFGINLKELIDDALDPALTDESGVLYLISTPGKIPRGIFFELTRQFDYRDVFSARRPRPTDMLPDAGLWSVHSWTTEQNPSMRERFGEQISKKLEANPQIEKDPEFLRNYRKAWVHILGEQVYLFDGERNTLPGRWVPREDDHWILAADFGWNDRQALSLCVWRDDSPKVVEVASARFERLLMDQLREEALRLMAPWVLPGADITMLGDPGTKNYFEEFRRRYDDMPWMPAEKVGKFEWINIANTSFRAGDILIQDPLSSPHVEEMRDLVWSVKADGRKWEARGLSNDTCDAFLYAFRHAMHYLRSDEIAVGPPTRQETEARIEAELIALEEEQLRRMNEAWNDF